MLVVGHSFVSGDKEIAVRIRSNSHYRNSVFRSSRNAYRFVTRKGLLGNKGEMCNNDVIFFDLCGMAGYHSFYSMYPFEGYFYFILLFKKERIEKNEKH